jgi:hypothetical protein
MLVFFFYKLLSYPSAFKGEEPGRRQNNRLAGTHKHQTHRYTWPSSKASAPLAKRHNRGWGPTSTTGLHPNCEPNDRGLAHARPLAATYRVPNIIPPRWGPVSTTSRHPASGKVTHRDSLGSLGLAWLCGSAIIFSFS